jgi:MYXO-CTERM domain-containing protein
VVVRQTSSGTPATTTDTVLTVGGVADTFSVTTVPADTTPDAFAFTDQTGVALNSAITSNEITVAGINAAAPISVTDGQYSINGGAFTAAAGTVLAGNTVRVRVTSSATVSTAVNATLTIGGVSDTFTATTTATPPSSGGGGSSSMDFLAIGLLGAVAFLRRRRLLAR